jgi:hypothetical protein
MRRSLARLVTVAVTLVMAGFCTTARVSAEEQLMASAAVTAEQSIGLQAVLASGASVPVASVPRIEPSASSILVKGPSESFGDSRRPALLPPLYASTIVLQVLDAHSTMSAIRNGAHEANPFMQGVAKNNGAMLAVKAGVAASTIFFAEKMWKRNRVGAVAMMVALNTIDALVVVHNYGVASRLR